MAVIKTKLEVKDIEFERAIRQELVKQINLAVNSVAKSLALKKQIFDLIDAGIKNSPEYDSLLSGKLSAIFGLRNPQTILNRIIEAIKDGLQIEVKPAVFSSLITAGITISLLRRDLQEVLNVEGVSYDSDGGFVDWLKWLLTAGDSVVIVDYEVVFGNAFVGSRSDFAIMEKNIGKGFSVPPEFSGTLDNNWLTRSLEEVDQLIGNILILELNKRF